MSGDHRPILRRRPCVGEHRAHMNAAAAFPRTAAGIEATACQCYGVVQDMHDGARPGYAVRQVWIPAAASCACRRQKKSPEGDCRSGPGAAGIRPRLGERTNAREYPSSPLESSLYDSAHKPRPVPCFCWLRLPASCRCGAVCRGRGRGAAGGTGAGRAIERPGPDPFSIGSCTAAYRTGAAFGGLIQLVYP